MRRRGIDKVSVSNGNVILADHTRLRFGSEYGPRSLVREISSGRPEMAGPRPLPEARTAAQAVLRSKAAAMLTEGVRLNLAICSY